MTRNLKQEAKDIVQIMKAYYSNNTVLKMNALRNAFKNPVWRVQLFGIEKAMIVKLIMDASQLPGKGIEVACFSFLLKLMPDFPVPKILIFDRTKNIVDCDFIIEEEVEGQDLCYVIERMQARRDFMLNLGNVIGRLHSITFDSCGYFDEDFNQITHCSWVSLVNSLFEKYLYDIESKSSLEDGMILMIRRYWKDSQDYLQMTSMPSLIHDDLTDRNIRVREIGVNHYVISGILDFELCMIGDPIKDLSKLQWFLRKFPLERRFFYEEYGSHIQLEDSFDRKIEAYCLLDRLKHFSLKEYLIKFEGWASFLADGEEEIKRIVLR